MNDSVWLGIVFSGIGGVLIGAALTFGTELYILKRNSSREKAENLRLYLGEIINHLVIAKEYWFLIVENDYMTKYDLYYEKYVKRNDGQTDAIVSRHTELFEAYRIRRIEVEARILEKIVLIRAINQSIADGLQKRMDRMNLSGMNVNDRFVRIDEDSVKKGLKRDTVSWRINQRLKQRGGAVHRAEALINIIQGIITELSPEK